MAFHCYSNTIQYMTVHVLETTPQPYSLRGLSGSVCGYAGGGGCFRTPRFSRNHRPILMGQVALDYLVVSYPLNHQK